MKRCPECRRDYFDDSLLYCLDDGAALLEGPSSGSDGKTAILDSDSNPFGTEKTRLIGRDSAEQVKASSSSPGLSGGIGKTRGSVAVIGGLVVVAVLGAGWALWKYFGKNDAPGPLLKNFALTRLTTSGRAEEATISPDGKYVVYLDMEEDGDRGLWIKQVATGDTIPIVPATKGNVLKGTTFSSDGNFVYYLFTDRTRRPSLYQVSSLGGTPKKISEVCDSAVAVSPDGQRLAFLRYESHTKANYMTAKSDGTDEKVLTSLEGSEWFSSAGASWSPDGKTIAVAAGITKEGVDAYRLIGIDVGDGSIRELSNKRWIEAGRVVWMPDGESLILTGTERVSEMGPQLWQVAYPSGSAAKLTNEIIPRDDTSLGVTSDGKTIVSATVQRLSRIEALPAGGQGSPTILSTTPANFDGFLGLGTLADGRIVFSSADGGQLDIWIMNSDGSGRRKLTSDPHWDGHLSVSPDGRYVLFKSNRPNGDAVPRLWRMNTDGTNLVQLAERTDSSPMVSPDGQQVIFASWTVAENTSALRRIPIDGGEAVRLSDYPVSEASYSPDGKWIGAYYSDASASRWKFGILPSEGGNLVRSFEFPSFQYEWVRFTPDGKYLSFIGAPPDPSNIWLQPFEGGEPRKLTDFRSEYIFRHEWSRDGRTLYLVRGRPSNDVVLQTTVQAE
jgi:Tol biopolymer transport system component